MEACCSRFTAAEGGARLAAAASSKNTLAVEYASFIATRLVHEDAYKIRGSLCEGRQRSVHVTRASRVDVVAYELHILTDLAITKSIRYDDVSDWSAELDKKEVLVCTSVVLKQLLEEKILSIPNMNVLILDSCHLVCKDDNLQYIMNLYKECKEERRPRILALTYPLFASPKKEPQDKLTNNNDSSRNVEKLPKIDETDEAAIKNGTVDTDTNIEETNIATTETDTKIENLDVKIAEIDVETTETKIIEIDTEEDTTDSKVEETDIEIENTSGKIETSNETEESTVEKNDDESKIKEVIKFEEEIGVSKNLDDFEMYEKLEWKIEELEKELCCQMDLAEDIDGGKRLSATIAKPKEIIVEYSAQPTREQLTESYVDLEKFMKDTVNEATKFIEEHRYDPTEIYGEEMYEEFMKIPDPTIEPKNVFRQFLYVLEQLGPYAADKAAFSLLTKLEKLKIKVPYERHFLLLCLCTTVFVKIRCYADDVFTKCETDWEKLRSFSTPKVLRFAEILEKFQPPEQTSKEIPKNADGISKTATDKKELSVKVTEMLKDIERCDFISLSNKIEDKVNTYEADLKEIHDLNIENINTTNELNNAQNESNEAQNETNKAQVETENSHNEANNAQEDTIIGQNENNKSQIETENLLKETDNAQDDTKIVQNESNKTQIETKNAQNDISSAPVQHKGILGFSRRAGHRARGRGRVQRSNAARVQQLQQNPDALCGIVFMKEALMAKIMFMLIVDMSRCNPKLAYLCAQYCAVETPADPGTEPRECQRQGKKQEDVLKKFRMHECNLLLATSALEEGIDLPRCNLVLRWDVPASYRSYGLCRSRARAPRAACCVLSRAAGCDTDTLLHNVAVYRELDQMISRKCGCGVQDEPPQTEEDHADTFTTLVTPYTPKENINDSKPASEPLNNDIKLNNDCDNDDVKTLDKTGSIHVDVTKNDERGIVNNENVNDNNYISKIVNDKPIDNDNDKIIDKTRRIHDDVNKNDERGIVNDVNINDNNDISKMVNDKSNDNEFVTNCDSVDEKILEKQNPSKNSEKISDENPEKIDKDSSSDKRKLNDCENLRVNENLQCNKCNNKRSSVNLECHCVVNVKNKLDSGDLIDRNKCDRKTDGDTTASVDLSSAIALINRYCGKLPSDTFTRLAPQWWMEQVKLPIRNSTEIRNAYICTLRLPLNCPVKYNIVGHPMPTRVLARRMVALQACRILHKSGELDNQLMPIGKENFKAAELEATGGHVISNGGDCSDPSDSARPGTTKRRQYYFKRTAWAFTDCQPVVDTTDADIEPPGTSDKEHCQPDRGAAKQEKKGTKRNMLYAIVSKLWCALPERYNTRGRRLHAPQNASQAIGILMARDEPDNLQIPAFPVYTRSGEVRVSVEHVSDADVRVSPRRGRLVRRFMRFVFAEVLRVRRRGMKLQSEGSTHNNYYIVPTVKTIREDGTTKIDIDWPFLELIYQHTEEKKHSEIEKPILWHHDEEEAEDGVQNKVERKEEREEKVKKMENPLLKDGESFAFDAEMYKEAVVTPWYRNQDQPQFFLVAEICWNLTPDSAFPSATHTSFRNYYTSKYAVVLSQSNQPLLDVDHTSARLNLLTPRYVNRKGVALPVSSERTRRAKRDRLDQKQILVPELCRVHPFAAPLWFATVALPCVLYRINALLIADEIRRAVAIDVGLGIPKIDESTSPGFQWPPLDFGWSLAEVLSADSEKSEKKKEDDDSSIKEEKDLEEEGKKSEIKKTDEEPKEKTINDILQKEINESGFEIGTWSNDMASSIPQEEEYDEYMEPLPPNLTFCTSASGGTNWCDPIEKPKNQFNPTRGYSMADSDCSYMSSDFDTDDSDLNTDASDDDTDTSGFCSSKNSNSAMGVRIEYKTAHEAEAVDVERKKNINPAPQPDDQDDTLDRSEHDQFMRSGTAPGQYIEKFHQSVSEHKKEIIENGFLIHQDEPILEILPDQTEKQTRTNTELKSKTDRHKELIDEIFPFGSGDSKLLENGQISLDAIEKNKRLLLDELKKTMSEEEIKKLNCFSMVDVDIDSPLYVNEKVVNVGFDTKDSYIEKVRGWVKETACKPYYEEGTGQGFDFDYQPKLEGHPGPSPSVILQALTMSNANDGINLERLETIGDSFLKFAITAYLYCAHPTVHEGKLSHMRSKQVSNLNLYRLGRNKRLGARMIASKFEPHDNWLPPCHKPPSTLHPRMADLHQQNMMSDAPPDGAGCFIPYNLITQHSIPDKSIADCVEALIGAYLLECGPRGALLFMSWLGIRVLPRHECPLPAHHPYVSAYRHPTHSDQKPQTPPTPKPKTHDATDSDTDSSSDDEEPWQQQQEFFPETDWSWPGRPVGSLRPYKAENGQWIQPIFGELKAPPSPLLRYIGDPDGELEQMLSGYDALERTLQYRFKDRSLLLQALTHASHQQNRLTDCYQRLEFLGDAILDYLITRHLYEDPRRHSPGALTDLRSALVNNTIFATLAARHGFHKYFRHMSPGLNEVLTKYVKIQEENGHSISEEHYLIQEDEMEQAEDVEVPKALGDLFESVAGAIFLDSGMSLGAVWKSYVNLMGAELEAFSAAAPKSPVRELLEAEPDTAKFGKPERLADGRRVRVCVEVFGRGAFKGVGRNYRIAKGTAARCALRHLRVHRAR